MHADEADIDETLVRRLIAEQFPQWAGLAIAAVQSAGTDNALFRLGEELAARLPRRPASTAQAEKEQRWLPYLAPHLPLAIPEPVAPGEPGAGYPWRWSVCRWLEGHDATQAAVHDPAAAARSLGAFVGALREVDATGAPLPGRHNFYRGVPLAERDERTREAIDALAGVIDTDAATSAWEEALAAPAWEGAPMWIHGDLAPGNLLVRGGKLSAVIDFGGLTAGDPACDLLPAWNFFDAGAREVFREAPGADDGMWARGRGWALSVALIQLPYYRESNPVLAASARHVIGEVLTDRARKG